MLIRRDWVSRSHAQVPPYASWGGALRPIAELSQSCAVQVIEPSVHMLIEEGGYPRRSGSTAQCSTQNLCSRRDTWLRIHPSAQGTECRTQEPAETVSVWDREFARPAGPSLSRGSGSSSVCSRTVSDRRCTGRSRGRTPLICAAVICAAGARSTHWPKR